MRLVLGLASTAALLLGLHGPLQAQAVQDFELVNRTGYTIEQVYIGPTSSDEWGDNILGDQEVAAGASGRVHFGSGSSECFWDIKVVYDDEDSTAWRRVNLCRISRITLFWDRAADTTRAVAE